MKQGRVKGRASGVPRGNDRFRLVVVAAAMVLIVAIAAWRGTKAPGPGSGPGSGPAATSLAGANESGGGVRAAPAANGSPSADEPSSVLDDVVAGPALARVRVGAWNIEWLGMPRSRSGGAKDVAQSAADLADQIDDSGAHLLALQEIVSGERGTPIRSREIEGVIDELTRRGGRGWKYVLFPGRQRGDQLTGVMWDARVLTAIDPQGGALNLRSAPWSVPIIEGRAASGGVLWARPPHAMKFRVGSAGSGKTDFVIVSLHMKADYRGDFAAQRAEEARALIAAMPELRRHFADQDVLLLGDTNAASDAEASITLWAEAGFVELNIRDRPTHYRGTAMMDRTLVPKDQPEFAGARFEVASEGFMASRGLSPEDFKRRLSDHYLVYCEFASAEDDD